MNDRVLAAQQAEIVAADDLEWRARMLAAGVRGMAQEDPSTDVVLGEARRTVEAAVEAYRAARQETLKVLIQSIGEAP